MVTSLVNEVVCLSQSGTSNLWYILLQYLWEIMGISPEMDSSAKHSQAIWYYIVQKHWGGHGAWCSGSYSFAAESGTVAWSDWLWQSVTCSVDRYPHASFYYFDIYFELFTQIRRTNYEHLLAEADTQTPCPLRWRRQVKTSCGQLQWMFSWSRLIMLHLDVHGRPISWEPFLWFLMHFQLMSDHVRSATFCNISECAGVTLIHCIAVRQ